jgi:hypothetical protein
MKLSRLAASGAGLALIAASTFVGATAASADDFYLGDTFPQHTDGTPYPEGWFLGQVSTPGTATSTLAGLQATGTYLLLKSTNTTTRLADLVSGADIVVGGAGQANFQIPMYINGGAGTGFTTLRPDNNGPMGLNPLAGWTTTGVFGAFTSGSSHTIPEYVAELATLGFTEKILAFGFRVQAGNSSTVGSISWDGDTYFFTPRPSVTVNPTSLAVADLAKPVTITASGFAAGETVSFSLESATSGDVLGTAIAGENGTAVYSYTFTPGSSIGDYFFFAFGEESELSAEASFSVVANVVPAKVLSATGLDATGTLLAGGVLLLAGAGIALVTLRRKSAQA